MHVALTMTKLTNFRPRGAVARPKQRLNLGGSQLRAWSRGKLGAEIAPPPPKFYSPSVVPGTVPNNVRMAMDSVNIDVYRYANSQNNFCNVSAFVGYPVLAQLTQISEYRQLSEKTAMAMTRGNWMEFKSKSGGDKSEYISKLQTQFERFKIKELFAEAAKLDGQFGACKLFVDLGEQGAKDPAELDTPLILDKAKLLKKLRKFKIVEPMYSYPVDYTADNPLMDTFYNPRAWYVMGLRVHSTRLLSFVGRPVPDMLKPAYNFGGISLSQLSMETVENWLKTRKSVNRIISNFSTTALRTNMADVLSGDCGDDLLNRAQLFNDVRDNQGLMLLNNGDPNGESGTEGEELVQLNTPLTTLDKLQAQAQEHMAAPSSMPLSILLGITPTGLNASTDGEIRIFYDHVDDMKAKLFYNNLMVVKTIIELSEFGAVDEDIYIEFPPLWRQTDEEKAKNRKADAETAKVYVEIGALSPEDVRNKVAHDPDSGYSGINVTDMPQPDESDDGKDTETYAA